MTFTIPDFELPNFDFNRKTTDSPSPPTSPNIFDKAKALLKNETYCLLPPKYDLKDEQEHTRPRWRYYLAEEYDKSDDAAMCRVVDQGQALETEPIMVPVSVIESRRVPKNEALVGVGESLYQHGVIKHTADDSTLEQVLQYGQVIKAEWKDNALWERIDHHALLHVRLSVDRVVQVRPETFTPCSTLCYLARPLELASGQSLDAPELNAVHRTLDESVFAPTSAEFKLAYHECANKSTETLDVGKSFRYYSHAGVSQTSTILEVINEAREAKELEKWPQPERPKVEVREPTGFVEEATKKWKGWSDQMKTKFEEKKLELLGKKEEFFAQRQTMLPGRKSVMKKKEPVEEPVEESFQDKFKRMVPFGRGK